MSKKKIADLMAQAESAGEKLQVEWFDKIEIITELWVNLYDEMLDAGVDEGHASYKLFELHGAVVAMTALHTIGGRSPSSSQTLEKFCEILFVPINKGCAYTFSYLMNNSDW